MLETVLYRNWRTITGPRGVWLLLPGFVMLCMTLRYVLFPGGSQDDAEMLVLSQSFEAVYKPGQPPLLNWILTALSGLAGPSLFLLFAVKGALMLATYWGLYGAARHILADRRHAVLAAMSPVAVYLFSWDAVFNYSHTLMVAALVAVTLHAALALRADGGRGAYLGLGLTLGVGFLAKYTFIFFVAGLIVAGLTDRRLRARLLHRRVVLVAVPALAMALPHGIWVLIHHERMAQAFNNSFGVPMSVGWFEAVGRGLLDLGDSLIDFSLPLLAILLVLFPRAWLPTRRGISGATEPARAVEGARFLAVIMATMLVLFAAGVPLARITEFRNHYFFVFLFFPLWTFARIEVVGASEIRLQWFAGMLTVFAGAIVLALFGRFLIGPMSCKRCYYHIPYGTLAAQIRTAGFRQGTIVVKHHFIQIAGNLRPYFPESRVISTKFPDHVPPRRPGSNGQCLLLWNAWLTAGEIASLKRYVGRRLGATVPADLVIRHADAPLAMNPSRHVRFAYLLLPRGSGDCR